MPTIRIVDRRYDRTEGWQTFDKVVTYPDGSKLQWDLNQHTLVIRDAAGEPIAAFTALSGVVRDDLVIVESEAKP